MGDSWMRAGTGRKASLEPAGGDGGVSGVMAAVPAPVELQSADPRQLRRWTRGQGRRLVVDIGRATDDGFQVLAVWRSRRSVHGCRLLRFTQKTPFVGVADLVGHMCRRQLPRAGLRQSPGARQTLVHARHRGHGRMAGGPGGSPSGFPAPPLTPPSDSRVDDHTPDVEGVRITHAALCAELQIAHLVDREG
jgi:hypothetical protein